MIWGPFLLAVALGLIVSAGLYFAYLWPQVEPDEATAPLPAREPKLASEAKQSGEPDKIVQPDVPVDEEPQTPPPSRPA
ncbi:MAG TPA: hypothetical protein VIV40_12705 [Kofleriaceae bacterium]